MMKVEKIEPLVPEDLRILQLTELELLVEFNRICKKNKIKYSVIGGTLLGAVRHKGFIPWDDDADVGLERSHYEAFVKACEQDLDQERFYFQDMGQTEGYRWGYGKLRRRNTSFVRPGTEHLPYEQGVYIDVMPLDYVPQSKTGQAFCALICFFFRKAAWAAVGCRTEKNPVYRLLYLFLNLIPSQVRNKAYAGYVAHRNRKPTPYLRCLTWPIYCAKDQKGYWHYRREWVEELAEYEFEGYSLMGFSDYDASLQRAYGAYRKPVQFPPISLSNCSLLPLDEIQVNRSLKELVGRDRESR